jgi:N-methylhydantoinase B/oxoprolinase/acetone carboxylase alpha subunit
MLPGARRSDAREGDGRGRRHGVQLSSAASTRGRVSRMPTTTLRGERLGRAADGDGESARNHIHGNCRNTPIEVFETRFPFRTLSYARARLAGWPPPRRPAVRRDLEVLAPEVTVKAFFDRVERGAWGLFGGRPGRCARCSCDEPATTASRLLRRLRHREPVEALGRQPARATSSGSRVRAAGSGRPARA